MILELRLEQWVLAGLAAYAAQPLLVEQVFFDATQLGEPTALADGVLTDTTKLWIPQEYVGGKVRWGGVEFPITANTATTLTVTGNPALWTEIEDFGYQIIPPAAIDFATLLQQATVHVLTDFAQMPTQFPAITIRLHRDSQADAYLGESRELQVLEGVEYAYNRTEITGQYLLSIWATNRLACLWLYAWVLNYYLACQQQFSTWGLTQVSMEGSDLDPVLQYLPERGYVRHFLFTATRTERALALRNLEPITSWTVDVCAAYAPFSLTERPYEPSA